MYKVFKVSKNEEKKNLSIPLGEVSDKELAIKRARRFGGYATEVATKKLVVQTLLPGGPNFQPSLKCISSGEDACEDC